MKTLEVLKKLHNILQELDALVQETSDLALVIQLVATFLRTPSSSPQDDAEPQPQDLHFLRMLEQRWSIMSKMDDFANVHVESNGSFTPSSSKEVRV